MTNDTMTKMPYKAAIFDLDGTLINSIPLWIEAYFGTLERFGASITRDEFLRNIYSKAVAAGDALEMLGVDRNNEKEFRKIRDDQYCDLLRAHPLWIGNTKEILPKITARISTAIVTGSWEHYIDAIDENIGIRNLIPIIVSASETPERQKPYPDQLFIAAERLNVDPSDCIDIGDQPYDIASAKNAGMSSCLLRGEFTPNGVGEDATYVVKSLEEIVPIIVEV